MIIYSIIVFSYDHFSASDIHCDEAIWFDGCGRYYCDQLRKSEIKTAAAMSIPYLISAFISPVLGKLVDQFGYRAIVACLAPLCFLFVHALLGLTRFDPRVILVFQGIAYSSYAAVTWPAIPLVVEEEYIGTYLFFSRIF